MKPDKIDKKRQEEPKTELSKALHKIIDDVKQMDDSKAKALNTKHKKTR